MRAITAGTARALTDTATCAATHGGMAAVYAEIAASAAGGASSITVKHPAGVQPDVAADRLMRLGYVVSVLKKHLVISWEV